MHRLVSVLLASILGFALIAPAISADAAAQLPPCCRANGKHHCATSRALLTAEQSSGPTLSNPKTQCPYSRVSTAAPHAQRSSTSSSIQFAFALCSNPVQPEQTRALSQICFDRARQKRAPPSAFLIVT